MRTSPTPLVIALLLSIAAHSLLLISKNQPAPYLSQHSIIHARLDKQNRELIQQEQTGQISQHHDQQISQARVTSPAADNQPKQQETVQASEDSQNPEVVSSTRKHTQTVLKERTENPVKDAHTPKTETKQAIEQTENSPTKPEDQPVSQTNNDSRAQVEALEGSEDPTYTSYRRVLQQYLSQRLEARADFHGSVRLKIKLEYGSVATSVNIIHSSGNLEIDNWAKRAALAASPYPKIPKEIGSTFEFSPTLQIGETRAP